MSSKMHTPTITLKEVHAAFLEQAKTADCYTALVDAVGKIMSAGLAPDRHTAAVKVVAWAIEDGVIGRQELDSAMEEIRAAAY